ncbi:EndoU domain-containing protein [Allosaccharopolyspora coralli]|uniref:EndoU domain-containing protein n=1 Tax=Allosaccharopolyspora coralli TaxID=2665642 RepID=UPI0016520226|nr:EndoU domain-containing protein [Allosaccharopolyspora coralli]
MAVQALTQARGTIESALDAPLHGLTRARDLTASTQKSLERVAATIETYLAAVLVVPSGPATVPVDAHDGGHSATDDAALALPNDVEQHLFHGHTTTRKITGYHHRPGGIDNGTFTVTDPQDPDHIGIYHGTVEGHTANGKPTRKTFTTFFPDSWPRNEVRRAIRAAFTARQPAHDRRGNLVPLKWQGTYCGIRVQGFLRPGTDLATATLDDLATAYPVPTPETRTP